MPKHVRLFKTLENDLRALEKEINSWVDATGAEIVGISGNVAAQTPASASSADKFSASDVLVIVLYELPVG